MKKKITSTFLILFVSNCIIAQNPVPNSGFENWTAGNPDAWITNNVPSFVTTIVQTPVAHAGSSAVQGDVVAFSGTTVAPFLTSTGITGLGFPVTQLYSHLNFYYKFSQVGSIALVSSAVVFEPGGGIISTAGGEIGTPSSSYTLASVPFFIFGTNPSVCQITFILSDTLGNNFALGNSFVIDDVSLSNSVGLEENSNEVSISKIFPNPLNQQGFIYYTVPSLGDVTFDVITVTGQSAQQIVLKNEIPGKHKIEFNTSSIAPGIYYVRMESKGKFAYLPFVKAL